MIQSSPLAPAASPGGHDRGPVVAGVRGFEREVRVVAVEVADVHAVGERRPVGGGQAAADERGRRIAVDARGDAARDRRRGFVEAADGAAQGVEQPPFGLRRPPRRADPRIGC